MSHATSDLEFFMCDMCQVYVHRDIFCSHRRECKGPNSQELRKAECEAIWGQIDKVLRPQNCAPLTKKLKECDGGVRRSVMESYQRKIDEELSVKVQRAAELLKLLES